MSGETIRVNLKGPAKVGSRWLKAGSAEVSPEEKAALEAAGLVEADLVVVTADGEGTATVITVTRDQFDEAVARGAKMLADAAVAEAVEAALREVILERDALAELVASLRQENAELSAQLDARADDPAPTAPGESPPETAEAGEPPARTDTPPSEKVAKTAPKKGAAATTKG